jgi:signal transduction histidine kinase
MQEQKPEKRVRPLALYMAGGLLLGVGYAFLNTLFDVISRDGPLIDALVAMHSFVDRGIPLLAGALLGLSFHYVHVRSALAREERKRADDLGTRLKKVERDQAVWVVVASTLHEVKNPLHSLGLLLDELGAAGATEQEKAELLARSRRQMDRIDESLTALRTLAEGARPAIGPIELGPLLGDLARDMMKVAGKEGISLEVHASPGVTAKADPNFIRIIVENLVGNSLDVLRARGSGKVDIEAVTEDDCAIVRVKDDGPGIEADAQDSLFEPLATTKARGLGLGLSIGRALARAMHGELTYETRPGWSTAFQLKLPGASQT